MDTTGNARAAEDVSRTLHSVGRCDRRMSANSASSRRWGRPKSRTGNACARRSISPTESTQAGNCRRCAPHVRHLSAQGSTMSPAMSRYEWGGVWPIASGCDGDASDASNLHRSHCSGMMRSARDNHRWSPVHREHASPRETRRAAEHNDETPSYCVRLRAAKSSAMTASAIPSLTSEFLSMYSAKPVIRILHSSSIFSSTSFAAIFGSPSGTTTSFGVMRFKGSSRMRMTLQPASVNALVLAESRSSKSRCQ